LGIPQDNRVLVAVGRLAEEKNMDELLRFRAAMGNRPTTLLLVGDGPDRPRLEGLAASLGLTAPAVIFAGMVPADQVADWYQMGDLFVSASTSETQGLTYVEALAAGVPALCRADPCLEGVILEGENGWEYQDQQEFLQKLEIAQTMDLAQMGQKARQHARNFSAVLFAERAESIYTEQIARHTHKAVSAKSAS
jgi:1,2-diacylglycerol 3-alpha-glucosyltransferase